MEKSKVIGGFLLLATLLFQNSFASLAGPTIKNDPDFAYRRELVKQLKIDRVTTKASSEESGPGQIMGSSSFESIKSAKSSVYFLYGAEHLKLKNYYFDFPVTYNKDVKKWMNYFLGKGKEFFVRYSERAGRYAPILGKILDDYGLPRDLIFLAMAESGFQNKAKSWARAVGPWQFMPYTGKKFGLKINWYIDERRDPIKATIAAAKYLKKLKRLFGSWELAAAGYNAGEGKIARAIKRYGTENFWNISKGRYLKRETKNYVPKIMALAIIGKNLESFGFKDIDFSEPLDFDEVDVNTNTDLIGLSEFMGVPFEEIQRLNPEILRWNTPPDQASYKLRVPVGFKYIWDKCCMNQDFLASRRYQQYRLKSNSSVHSVAAKFRIKKTILEEINNISGNKRLRKGETVYLPFREGQSKKDSIYVDLYERPKRYVRRRNSYTSAIREGFKSGKHIKSPSEYYKVRKGDTLWTVARQKGVSINTIIRSNYKLLSRGRMLRPGDLLVIR